MKSAILMTAVCLLWVAGCGDKPAPNEGKTRSTAQALDPDQCPDALRWLADAQKWYVDAWANLSQVSAKCGSDGACILGFQQDYNDALSNLRAAQDNYNAVCR